MRYLLFIILTIFGANAFGADCDKLWVEDANGDELYEDIKKVALSKGSPSFISPKAIKHALQSHSPSRAIHRMKTMKLSGWTFIYSNTCDKQAALNFENINKIILQKYDSKSSKSYKVNFKGAELGAVISSYTNMCNIPINIKVDRKENIKIWLASNGYSTGCADFSALLAGHGIILEISGNTLVTRAPNNNFHSTQNNMRVK